MAAPDARSSLLLLMLLFFTCSAVTGMFI